MKSKKLKYALRRTAASILCASVVWGSIPMDAVYAAALERKQIKEQLAALVNETEYPNGMFQFLAPRVEVCEGTEYVEIAVVRAGNTDSEASVTFKALDVSAKYGEDYKITVPKLLTQDNVEYDEDVESMMEQAAIQAENTIVKLENDTQSNNSIRYSEAGTSPDGNSIEAAKNDTNQEASSEAIEEELVPNSEVPTNLRDAKELSSGVKSDDSSWTDEKNAEEISEDDLISAYNDKYESMEGAEYTFTFKKGEYMKKLRVYIEDDSIGEDDELVMLALSEAEGAALSDNPTGLINIKDNDEYKVSKFSIDEETVTVKEDSSSAVITVRREEGIEHYGEVSLNTAENTAVSGVHYEGVTKSITFQPGQEYQKVEIPVYENRSNDENVNFTVSADDTDKTEIIVEPSLCMSSSSVKQKSSQDIWTARAKWTDVCAGATWEYWAGQSGLLINQDLSMVGRITVDIENDSNGTFWEDGMWWWYESGYNTDYSTYFNIGSNEKFTQKGKFSKKTVTINLTDDDRAQNYMQYGTTTRGGCRDSHGKISNMSAYYLPIKVTICDSGLDWGKESKYTNRADRDAWLYTRTYTGVNQYTENETKNTAKYIGSLKFTDGWYWSSAADDGRTQEKIFYNNDTVSLTADYDCSQLSSEEKDKMYLWGFKIESKDMKNIGYYYVEGDSFKISDLYKGNLDGYYIDSNGNKKYGKVNVNNTKMDSDGVPTFKLYPVFRQKTAAITMTIDENKAVFNAATFKNNSPVICGMLDTVSYDIAGKGSYIIENYNLYGQTCNAMTKTTASKERELYKKFYNNTDKKADNTHALNVIKNYSPYNIANNKIRNSSWPVRDIFTPEGVTKGQFSVRPCDLTDKGRNELHLVACYEQPTVSMTVYPKTGFVTGQKNAQVTYTDTNGKTQIAEYKYMEDSYVNGSLKRLLRGSVIKINPFILGDSFIFNALVANPDKYQIKWGDYTGDTNLDGNLDADELRALGKYADMIDRGVVAGDSYLYTPLYFMGNRQLYYQVVNRTPNETGVEGVVSGNVYYNKKTVVENTEGKTGEIAPLQGAQVVVGGLTTYTDENGYFKVSSADFRPDERYNVTINKNGQIVTAVADVNIHMNDIVLQDYTMFNITDFKAYTVSNVSEYENVEKWQDATKDLLEIDNRDIRYKFTFNISNMSTQIVGKVDVNRYGIDGKLKKTYSASYVDGVYVVNATKNNAEDKDSGYYSFNPATENVNKGDYFTIRVYDQNDVAYAEHEVGIQFQKKLSTITVLNSFDAPYNGVIEFIGEADTYFDLGMTAAISDKIDDKVKSLVTIVTTQDEETKELTKTISAGWSNDWKKEADKEESGEAETAKTPAEKAMDEAKKEDGDSGNASIGTDKDKSDTAEQLVDKDSENESTAKVTNDWSASLNIAFSLTMKQKDINAGWYFEDFVVVATLAGDVNYKYSYTTPIGITIFVTAGFGGDITGIMGVERYRNNYQYFDDDNKIDLTTMGISDADRKMTFYGELDVNPYITLGAGAGVDKVASVSLDGRADFNMAFRAAGNGAGKVKLSGTLTLELIGGLVEKKWLLGEYEHDLFSYNDGGLARKSKDIQLFNDGTDFRYETVSASDVADRTYLDNQSEWNGQVNSVSDGMGLLSYTKLRSVGTEALNEHTLQENVYPNAYPLIDTISSDGFNSEQIMVWLGDDGTQDKYNKSQLMYSVYSNGKWSMPAKVDNDNTCDDTPMMYNMGNGKVLILWSSAEVMLNENMDAVDMMNCRNIKARFFDCTTKTMGDISLVTKTTAYDSVADYAPSFAYTEKDGKEYLIVNYVKSEYERTNDDEVLVGDMLNPYSTVGMRLYDFENEKWNDTWGMEIVDGMTQSQIDEYIENWYGQNFAVVSQYAVVDEASILDENTGLWTRKPDTDMIHIVDTNSDSEITECESIGYDGKAIFAYVVDKDRDKSTLDDRDVYLQIYDFEQDLMYMPIKITDDYIQQSYIELEETNEGKISLFYLSDGDIMELDITQLMTDGLVTKDSAGCDVWLFDKSNKGYTGPQTVYEAQDDMPLTEYIALSDGYNTYLTWTEREINYKDGVDITSEEAKKPENYFEESQIYMMMKSGEYYESVIYDADGTPLVYPVLGQNGETIDYNTVQDINGNVGEVEAGDTIIAKGYAYRWSNPIDVTDEQGANYTDIDFVLARAGVLRMVYLKGMSEIMEVDGTMVSAENEDARDLMVTDYDLSITSYDVVFDNTKDIIANNTNVVYMSVKNNTILARENITVDLYANDEYVGTANVESLAGGATEKVGVLWNAPSSIDNVTLMAKLSEAGLEAETTEETLEYKDNWIVEAVSAQLVSRDTAEITATVTNIGTENSDSLMLHTCISEKTKAVSDKFSLRAGETKQIIIEVPVKDEDFAEIKTEDGSVMESLIIEVQSDNNAVEAEVIRNATAEQAAEWNSISEIMGVEGTVNLKVDEIKELEYELSDADGNVLEGITPTVIYESLDEDIAEVIDGKLIGNKEGTARIRVTYAADSKIYQTLDNGFTYISEDITKLPSSMLQTKEITVNVISNHESGDDDTKKPEDETMKPEDDNKTDIVSPTTGDSTRVYGYICAIIVSMTVMILVAKRKKKKSLN